MTENPLRFQEPHAHLASPFGGDAFGRRAEAFARLFGTPSFLIAQTFVVVVWIALNAAAASLRWDPYPFILLNLAFSTQAAYAAPLILLAQTRQAEMQRRRRAGRGIESATVIPVLSGVWLTSTRPAARRIGVRHVFRSPAKSPA